MPTYNMFQGYTLNYKSLLKLFKNVLAVTLPIILMIACGPPLDSNDTVSTNSTPVAEHAVSPTHEPSSRPTSEITVQLARENIGEPVVATSPIFKEVSAAAGITFWRIRNDDIMPIGGGAIVLDYNNDGFQDIYAVNTHDSEDFSEIHSGYPSTPNALYRNNGSGNFRNVAEEAGVSDSLSRGNGACAADFNNDGYTDMFVANWGFSRLYFNNGDGSFSDIAKVAGVSDPDGAYRSTGCAWGDYDQDGLLDLIVVRHMDESRKEWLFERRYRDAVRPLALFRNNGDLTFENVTALLDDQMGYPSNIKGAGFQPGFIDFDNDGDADIYVVNDFGADVYPNVLWRNDGPGKNSKWVFTDISMQSGANVAIWGMSLAVGDYENDGNLDIYITNIGNSVLLRNNGDETFSERTSFAGVELGEFPGLGAMNTYVGWGAVFFDYDNDGLLDLYVSRGFLDSDALVNPEEQPNALMKNNGDGTFSDVSSISGADDIGIGRGVISGDFNNDGRLDLFLMNLGVQRGLSGVARLFINTLERDNNWLTVRPIGVISNRDGIGARITLKTASATQIREIRAGGSQMSQSMTPAHFGLGSANTVEVLQIRWPSGIVQKLMDVPANQIITIRETRVSE